jgi:hypothetical protein
MLPPATQMRAYQHFTDLRQAKNLFANLTDAKTHDEGLDEHDESKGHLVVRAIEDWELAGFPGTWETWWKGWWDNHVAEHKEWLVWLRSDSGLNFWDWQAQKGTKPTPHGPQGDEQAGRIPSLPE